jgi:cell division control protein 6
MDDIFEREMLKNTVFLDRNVLTAHYIPDTLPHREREIEKVMKTLSPVLKRKPPRNLFIYGKTGTGKTSTTKHVVDKLLQVKEKYNAPVDSIYINCRILNTKYQVLLKCAEFCNPKKNFIGFPFSVLLDAVTDYIKNGNINFLIVLDEVDKVKNLDDMMYSLTRTNEALESGHLGLIGITNNVTFKKELDPRSRSTLCEEEMVFSPYNAEQLQAILKQRVKLGFKEKTIEDSAINLASALAAQESGDARYALNLIMRAGELADDESVKKVNDNHVSMARKVVEEEIVYEMISNLPEHEKIVLYAVACLTAEGSHYHRLDGTADERVLFSGEVYEKYESVCRDLDKSARSARWCREYINDLDMLGLITISLSGKGVRGNTTLIRLAFPADKVKEVIEKRFES